MSLKSQTRISRGVIVDNADQVGVGSVTANAGTNLNTSALALETGGNLATLTGNTPDLTGTLSYAAGTLTSSTLTASGRCLWIYVFASGADGTYKINSGNTITVRSGQSQIFQFGTQLSNPVVTWVSGTLDVVIAVIT